MNNELLHYGVGWDDDPPGIGSGRYPHGSGENPDQHVYNRTLYEQAEFYRKQGLGDGEVAKILGYKSSTQLRDALNLDSEKRKQKTYESVMKLYNNGITSPTEIGKKLGMNESSVRSIISKNGRARREKSEKTKNEIKALVAEYKYVDVGTGSEIPLGISETKRKQIINELRAEGYVAWNVYIDQLGTKFKTTLQVLCPPGTTKKEVYDHKYEIKPIERIVIDENGDRSVLGLPRANSVDMDRVQVRYAEEGGKDKDGTIELRRGAEDLSLGKAQYAQVRIGVDDQYYMKGMAFYGDDKDFEPGKDIIYNTNKHEDAPMDKVFKPMKTIKGTNNVDWDNPFGATIKREEELTLCQRYYTDKNGNRKVSPINVVNEEGEWGKWSKNLSSQFLSKQPEVLIKQQLNLAYLSKKDELSDIMTIDNASVRKVMLENFADMCDSAAVDLKAMSLPRQQTHVILPLTSIKNNEIFAPNYTNGEEVILVRHPHEGTYQIPRLIVNNNNREGRRIIGLNSPDAVGISPKSAEQLSGADFDGDNVIVIPIRKDKGGNVPVKTEKAIKALIDYDAKEEYPAYPGMTKVKDQKEWNKQREMGSVSNLITDMTLIGAPTEDLILATRHSMCVIDAEKHNLDWKRSERENKIAELKKKYQGKERGGASTLISRASAQKDKEQEAFTFKIDAEGNKIHNKTGRMELDRRKVGEDENGRPIYETKTDKDTGEVKWKKVMQKSTRMAETQDAYTLLSGYNKVRDRLDGLTVEEAHKLIAVNSYKKEVLYADYANQMKELARKARLEYVNTKTAKKDVNAAKTYAKEVEELETLAANLTRNAPREHQAQLRAANNYYKKKSEYDDLDKDDLKKLRNQCLSEARYAVGAEGIRVSFTPKQWEAIENHAISGSKVEKLVKKAKTSDVLSYALVRNASKATLPRAKQSLIKALANGGASNAEIAERLGISVSTVQKYLKE